MRLISWLIRHEDTFFFTTVGALILLTLWGM